MDAKKKHKNMNDNHSLVTKTGFNGLYQTVKTWLKHILFLNEIRHMHGLPVLCEVFPPIWRLKKWILNGKSNIFVTVL